MRGAKSGRLALVLGAAGLLAGACGSGHNAASSSATTSATTAVGSGQLSDVSAAITAGEKATFKAVYAATSPDAKGGLLYGPKGFQHLSGAPAQEPLYSRLARPEDGRKIWEMSERLVGVNFPA